MEVSFFKALRQLTKASQVHGHSYDPPCQDFQVLRLLHKPALLLQPIFQSIKHSYILNNHPIAHQDNHYHTYR